MDYSLARVTLKLLKQRVVRKKHWLLETESIDVLLTDITMPEMSGIELIEQAKKKDINLLV